MIEEIIGSEKDNFYKKFIIKGYDECNEEAKCLKS